MDDGKKKKKGYSYSMNKADEVEGEEIRVHRVMGKDRITKHVEYVAPYGKVAAVVTREGVRMRAVITDKNTRLVERVQELAMQEFRRLKNNEEGW